MVALTTTTIDHAPRVKGHRAPSLRLRAAPRCYKGPSIKTRQFAAAAANAAGPFAVVCRSLRSARAFLVPSSDFRPPRNNADLSRYESRSFKSGRAPAR